MVTNDIVIDLPQALPRPVLALGSELKNTVCCGAGTRLWLSTPLDDLRCAADLDVFEQRLCDWPRQLGIEPDVLAYDPHPNYSAAAFVRRADIWPGACRIAVQHHMAHVAAGCVAEEVWTPCTGLAFDGTGYGTDGMTWGGEFFAGAPTVGFTHIGRLRPFLLPGAERAITEPWRIALALAHAAGISDIAAPPGVAAETFDIVRHLLTSSVPTVVRTTSAGRLFDGLSAMLNLCTFAEQEAQAARALEHAATQVGEITDEYPVRCTRADDGVWELDWRPMLRQAYAEQRRGEAPGMIAARFHAWLARASVALIIEAGETTVVVASGGVLWNALFRRHLSQQCQRHGIRLVTPRRVPPSDASVAVGQAVLASHL